MTTTRVQLSLARFLTREHHRIHLIGVAGSGMSGVAALLLELGHQVSGSDKSISVEVERLRRLGLQFFQQHSAQDAADAELIVYSSAIRPDNPILISARQSETRTARRAEALAAIMQGKRGIIVCGMHGKTTTSAMTAHVLREGGLHPSHYVGAEIPILGQNAHWDPRGEFFVAEGDESDGTIRCFYPEHILVLNIEPEHLDFYEDLVENDAVFYKLIGQTSGKVFFCADDAIATRVCKSDRSVSYGFGENVDYRAQVVTLEDFASVFSVFRRGEKLGEAKLNVPGRHKVQNAIGDVALSSELGIPFEKIATALPKFRHARRRFEIKYASDRFMLVDNYAHHPTEIRATLATARSTGRNRVLTMFQPHRYSRTKALRQEFGAAFDQADRVIITYVYPAIEPRTDKALAELIRFCRQENLPLFVIGRGSNLLVRDGGITGVVVHPCEGEFDDITVNGNEITAGVGAKLKQVAYAGRDAGTGGLEWMEGIPGEVGGALRMNAGAMDGQTFEHVVSVRLLDAEGNAHRSEEHTSELQSLTNLVCRLLLE